MAEVRCESARLPAKSTGGLFFYSPDRDGEHPEQQLAGYAGLMRAGAYAGFGNRHIANRVTSKICSIS
jgi:hypothetical protein